MLCVRSERRRQERAALCNDIISRLAAGKSCHQRMLFLRVCPILFDLLSRKFIRQNFFLPLVRLAGTHIHMLRFGFFSNFPSIFPGDKVANVRLRFASLLPKLHMSLRGLDVESEKRLIVELDSAVRWLVDREKDRDVKNELASFFRWVEEQEGPNRTAEAEIRLQEEDEADKRKESEEESVDTTTSAAALEASNFFPKEEAAQQPEPLLPQSQPPPSSTCSDE